MTRILFRRLLHIGFLSCLAVSSAFAAPLAQSYTVVFHNPDPEYYVEGPGLVRFDDGALVAVVPVVPGEQWSEERRARHSRAHIVRSNDGGTTWQSLGHLPY